MKGKLKKEFLFVVVKVLESVVEEV